MLSAKQDKVSLASRAVAATIAKLSRPAFLT